MYLSGKLLRIKRLYIELIQITSRVVLNQTNTIEMVKYLERKDSAEFVRNELEGSLLFSNRVGIQNYAAEISSQHGKNFLELGVYTGNSLRRISKIFFDIHEDANVAGIDSFQGLVENWSDTDSYRAFDMKGVKPKNLDNRIILYEGFVEQKIADYKNQFSEQISLLHIDLDLYRPTKFSLEELREQCKSGTHILFDDHHGYPGWKFGEYKALNEVYSYQEYSYVAFGPHQALIRIN